jgi:hypothetical protein
LDVQPTTRAERRFARNTWISNHVVPIIENLSKTYCGQRVARVPALIGLPINLVAKGSMMKAFDRIGWTALLVSAAGLSAACGDSTAGAPSASASTPPAKSASAKPSAAASSAPAPSAAPSAAAADTPCAKAVAAMFKLKHPNEQETPDKASYEIKNCETEKWSQKGIDCILAAKDTATAEKCDLKK